MLGGMHQVWGSGARAWSCRYTFEVRHSEIEDPRNPLGVWGILTGLCEVSIGIYDILQILYGFYTGLQFSRKWPGCLGRFGA